MKNINPICSYILLLLHPLSLFAGTNYIDSFTWIQKVHGFRYGGPAGVLRLESYDEQTVQEYFRHLPDQEGELLCLWKLMGLASYGSSEDIERTRKLADDMAKRFFGNSSESKQSLDRVIDVLLARNGNIAAWNKLRNGIQDKGNTDREIVWLVALIRTKAGCDILASLAKNNQASLPLRIVAIEALRSLRDNRALEIFLSKNFEEALIASNTYTVLNLWHDIFGFEKFKSISSMQHARNWVKKNRVRLQPATKIISSKVDWNDIMWDKLQ